MTTIHHLNCGSIRMPSGPKAICHCLVLEDDAGLALVDTGIGVLDVRDAARLGRELIDRVGFVLDESEAAARQLEQLGFRARDVRHVVLTHADCDHAGGLADVPHALVHVAGEELASLRGGEPRYRQAQFEHGPRWQPLETTERTWYGLEARPVPLGFDSEVLLVPLVGHTAGHCGVAVQQGDRWLLHAGDAYYLRIEIDSDRHPVSELAASRAVDNENRRASLRQVRRLLRDHAGEIDLFCAHDPSEFPRRVR